MNKGILIKKYGGFYFVLAENSIFRCVYRGKHRLTNKDIFPGDYVEFHFPEDSDKGVIEEVCPRKNLLYRPTIANVSLLVCAAAFKYPQTNFYLLDRLLVIAEAKELDTVICFNKKDLAAAEQVNEVINIYERAGYKVIVTSAMTGEGLDEVRNSLKDNISVFAGQSGVGKSTLLKAITGIDREIGEISVKSKRGKHTTKYVELLNLQGGGLVADTPGFSKVDLPDITKESLAGLFLEFRDYIDGCKFTDCLHKNEPKCRVKEAVEAGDISEKRYQNYLTLLEEVISRERSF